MKHLLTRALAACLSGLAMAAAQAAPVSLDLSFSNPAARGSDTGLQRYTGSAAVNVGAVNTRDVLYFVEEAQVDGLQAWYLFFDPAGGQSVTGHIAFDGAIVDVITHTAGLIASQAIYGVDIDGDGQLNDYGVRGLMGLEGEDRIDWTPGGQILTIQWNAINPGDHVRVLVQAADVPEPATALLVAVALAGAAWTRRRR